MLKHKSDLPDAFRVTIASTRANGYIFKVAGVCMTTLPWHLTSDLGSRTGCDLRHRHDPMFNVTGRKHGSLRDGAKVLKWSVLR